MISQISMQAVVSFVICGVAGVCIAFVLYWKLLAEKHLKPQLQQASTKAFNHNQYHVQAGKLLASAER